MTMWTFDINPKDAAEDEAYRRAGDRGTPGDTPPATGSRVAARTGKAVRLKDVLAGKDQPTEQGSLGVWVI